MTDNDVFRLQERKALRSTTSAEEVMKKKKTTRMLKHKQKRRYNMEKRRKMLTVHDIDSQTLNTLNAIPQLVNQLLGNIQVKQEALTRIKLLLNLSSPPIDKLLAEPLIQHLCPIYKDAPQSIKYDVFWIIHNLSVGDELQIKPLLETYFIDEALEYISRPEMHEPQFVDLALSFIGNICCTESEMMISKGVIPPLLALMENYYMKNHPEVPCLMYISWIVSRICKAQATAMSVVSQLLPIIVSCVYEEDMQVMCDATWAVHYICSGSEQGIQLVLETSIGKQLVKLLMHPEDTISLPALKALGDIVRGNDYQTQQVINVGFIPALIPLVHSATVPSMISELCWIISNLTAGDVNQTEQVLKTNMMPCILNFLRDSNKMEIKVDAAYVFANILQHHHLPFTTYLIQRNIMDIYDELLTSTSPLLLDVILKSIYDILVVGDKIALRDQIENQYAVYIADKRIVDKIEYLLYHDHPKVTKAANLILNHYFDNDGDNDMQQDFFNHEGEENEYIEPQQFPTNVLQPPPSGYHFS